MEEKELDLYITLFLSVHKGFTIKYRDEFNKQDKHNVKFMPKTVTLVSDENEIPEFLCYYPIESKVENLINLSDLYGKP